ncbi:MAG: glycyl-radical enzyme activating protein [Bacteroidales bacterium]|nr:glycyl-radical enzyme activating protein [Bacteroidales bacterium]
MQGIVFDIKRFAVHDGPGIRTTIFLKGCPLSCWWCHNPEGIFPEIQYCTKTVRLGEKTFHEAEQVGKEYDLRQVLSEIEKEALFHEESGGGVTLSGGEPMMQFEFVLELLQELRSREIHTCLDTSGYFTLEKLQQVMPLVNLFLFDLKLLDDQKHLNYTGVSNRRILQNLETLIQSRCPVIIRYPLIPGINNGEKDLEALHARLDNRVKEIHFLPFHAISVGKWSRIGLEYKLKGLKPQPESSVTDIRDKFTQLGYKVSIGG